MPMRVPRGPMLLPLAAESAAAAEPLESSVEAAHTMVPPRQLLFA